MSPSFDRARTEQSRALARKRWVGRLQGERYRLRDNFLEMHAATKDIPAVAAACMGDAAHGFSPSHMCHLYVYRSCDRDFQVTHAKGGHPSLSR